MANWLAKASSRVSRETDETPQEFRLACECGQRHQGHRRSKAQRIVCQTCGAALFVLPRNVYPVLQTQRSGRRRRGKSSNQAGGLASVSSGIGRGASNAARNVGRSIRGAAHSGVQKTAQAVQGLAAAIRAQMTPLRLVFAGIVLLLSLTGAWALHSRNLERSRETLRIELDAGRDSLQSDRIAEAHEHFERAAQAAATLREVDARSRLAGQMLHETTAMTKLATASLLEILEEAEQTINGPRPELWETRFRSTYAHSWLVLQAPISRFPVEDRSDAVLIDMPLVVGPKARSVTVIAEVAPELVERLSETPQPAIFAAELADCVLDPDTDRWMVTLRSNEGFLWSDLDNLRRLGFFEAEWASEEETRQLLDAQARLGGVE